MASKQTTKSRTGAQFYQSDAEKKARLATIAGETETGKAINKAFRKKYESGDITREEYIASGGTSARIFVDSVEDAMRPPKASGNGRAVMKGRGGSFKGVR